MPSCITHQLIAEEALPFLPPHVRLSAMRHFDYIFLGAQGPDLFFFHRPFSRKEQNAGKLMHRRGVYESFLALAKTLRTAQEEERERICAYTAGYLCHYCADVIFHPTVYRFMELHALGRAEHQLVESDWDVYFARALRGSSAYGWKFPVSVKKMAEEEPLFRIYAALLNVQSLRPPTKKSFRLSLSLAARYLDFFHKKCRRKGFQRIEKIFRITPLVSNLYPREQADEKYIKGAEFEACAMGAKTADALFAASVRDTARLSELFFSLAEKDLPLPREPFNKSFLSAKPAPPAT